jgi:hypothetical protein
MHRTSAFLALLASLAVGAAATTAVAAPSASYDPARQPFRIPAVSGEIRIDGAIDDPAWNDALVLHLRYEQSPGENTPPPVETEVRLACGASRVYAAFICHDPTPTEIRAHYADRDALWSDDWVLLVLDTFNSEREAYNFACNPLGIQGDTYETPQGESESWDGIWDSAGRVTADGYQVEMAIPYSTLRFQRTDGEQVWGFDVARYYPRNVGHRFGFFPVNRDDECYQCQYSKLVGFEDASPGRNVELDPTVTALVVQEREGVTNGDFKTSDETYEAGLTSRWGITPNMTLTGTANPDFSQVEADARQLDVNTKFALSYPEKRPFFLEGEDFFADRLGAVYTRAVADPSWGAKLTGREGPHMVGAFVARDEMTNLIIPGAESSSVATLGMESTAAALRYRLDLGRSSGLGLLATDREADGYFNRVAGIDGFLRFLKSERLDFQVLGTWTDYPESTAQAYGQPEGELRDIGYDAMYAHRSQNVHWYVHGRYLGDDYRTDLGFRPQVGTRHTCYALARNWRREAGSWFTLLELGAGASDNRFEDGRLQLRSAYGFLNYTGPMQSIMSIQPALSTQVYGGREYDLTSVYVETSARPTDLVGLDLELSGGDGIDYDNYRKGRELTLEPSCRLSLGRHLDVTLSHEYSRMDVDGGRLYTANISYLKGIYQFDARTFIRAILQYVNYEFTPELYIDPIDPEYRSLSSQVLFSYKLNPYTVFFLGYSDSFYGDHETDLTQTGRTFFAKLGYAWTL